MNPDIEKMVANRLMRTNEEFEAFEDALLALSKWNDSSTLEQLYAGFDDQTEEHGVQFGLIHLIESFDSRFGTANCTKAFIAGSNRMIPHASEWLRTLLFRYLNSTESIRKFKKGVEGSRTFFEKACGG